MTSIMLSEAREAPGRVAAQAEALAEPLAHLVARLRASPPPAIVTCARGSSDHVATYAKYVLELMTGRPVASLGLSVVSVYDAQLAMPGMLFLAISQSGMSPDIVKCTEAARRSGALTVAIVNDPSSPLAEASEIVLSMSAGTEHAVAATKSFICSLTAVARLGAEWTEDAALRAALSALPQQLSEAVTCDWETPLADVLQHAQNGFVISRGPGFGIAAEIALKLKETSALHAEMFSAAEIQHGPKAAVRSGTPVLSLATGDAGQPSIDTAAEVLTGLGARVFSTGKGGALPVPDTGHYLTRPIAAVAAFYPFAARLAELRGHDPDNPPSLSKVTRTL